MMAVRDLISVINAIIGTDPGLWLANGSYSFNSPILSSV